MGEIAGADIRHAIRGHRQALLPGDVDMFVVGSAAAGLVAMAPSFVVVAVSDIDGWHWAITFASEAAIGYGLFHFSWSPRLEDFTYHRSKQIG